jgi:hypothetical protein
MKEKILFPNWLKLLIGIINTFMIIDYRVLRYSWSLKKKKNYYQLKYVALSLTRIISYLIYSKIKKPQKYFKKRKEKMG